MKTFDTDVKPDDFIITAPDPWDFCHETRNCIQYK